jgi:hypothetical protein
MTIKWKVGSRVSAKPEDAYEVLEAIREEHDGEIPPEAIVEASEPEEAPLHNEFEWDDAKAGKKYRLDQARYIVRSIEVVRVEMPDIQSRAYEATYASTEEIDLQPRKVYRTTEDILADPIARAELLQQFLQDIDALKRRYAMLSELAQIWEAVDNASVNI